MKKRQSPRKYRTATRPTRRNNHRRRATYMAAPTQPYAEKLTRVGVALRRERDAQHEIFITDRRRLSGIISADKIKHFRAQISPDIDARLASSAEMRKVAQSRPLSSPPARSGKTRRQDAGAKAAEHSADNKHYSRQIVQNRLAFPWRPIIEAMIFLSLMFSERLNLLSVRHATSERKSRPYTVLAAFYSFISEDELREKIASYQCACSSRLHFISSAWCCDKSIFRGVIFMRASHVINFSRMANHASLLRHVRGELLAWAISITTRQAHQARLSREQDFVD